MYIYTPDKNYLLMCTREVNMYMSLNGENNVYVFFTLAHFKKYPVAIQTIFFPKGQTFFTEHCKNRRFFFKYDVYKYKLTRSVFEL